MFFFLLLNVLALNFGESRDNFITRKRLRVLNKKLRKKRDIQESNDEHINMYRFLPKQRTLQDDRFHLPRRLTKDNEQFQKNQLISQDRTLEDYQLLSRQFNNYVQKRLKSFLIKLNDDQDSNYEWII